MIIQTKNELIKIKLKYKPKKKLCHDNTNQKWVNEDKAIIQTKNELIKIKLKLPTPTTFFDDDD